MVPLERWQARNAPHRWSPPEGWHRRAERARRPAREGSVRRGFARVFRRMDRAAWLRRHQRPAERAVVAVAAAIAAYVSLVNLSPWPPLATIGHLIASKSCRAAWEVGLTPARQGEPGYWARHDYEPDGLSCENWTEQRRAAGLYPFDGSDGPGRRCRPRADGRCWYYPYPDE